MGVLAVVRSLGVLGGVNLCGPYGSTRAAMVPPGFQCLDTFRIKEGGASSEASNEASSEASNKAFPRGLAVRPSSRRRRRGFERDRWV